MDRQSPTFLLGSIKKNTINLKYLCFIQIFLEMHLNFVFLLILRYFGKKIFFKMCILKGIVRTLPT